VHLETALKGVIIGDRWPNAGLDIIVTVLEGEDDEGYGDAVIGEGGTPGWGMMNVLAGCITVASAALSDARIDCLDLISGGVAAIVEVEDESGGQSGKKLVSGSRRKERLVLDPCPSEHGNILATCVVGYLASSDEITELWLKGDIPYGLKSDGDAPIDLERLMGGAVDCATMTRTVLVEAVREGAELLVEQLTGKGKRAASKKRPVDDDHDRMEE
jgi:exosome complex component MTR3